MTACSIIAFATAACSLVGVVIGWLKAAGAFEKPVVKPPVPVELTRCEYCKDPIGAEQSFCRRCGSPLRIPGERWPEGKKLIVLDEKYDPIHNAMLVVWASEQYRYPRLSRVPDSWSNTESDEMKLDMLKRCRLPNSGAIIVTHSEYDVQSNSYCLEWVRQGLDKQRGLSRIPNHRYQEMSGVNRQGVDELILHYQVKEKR